MAFRGEGRRLKTFDRIITFMLPAYGCRRSTIVMQLKNNLEQTRNERRSQFSKVHETAIQEIEIEKTITQIKPIRIWVSYFERHN
jgi:tRNA 2-selenouridine synthase SelU